MTFGEQVITPDHPWGRGRRCSTLLGVPADPPVDPSAAPSADPPADPIAALRPLVGTWRGEGRGSYPTIEPFAYAETVVIEAMPAPVLSYTQRTRHAEEDRPLHAESGWFRMPGGRPELVIAQPTGVTEVLAGQLEDGVLTLRSTEVGMTPSATVHRITATRRVLTLQGDVLRYRLAMAAVGEPLTHHLEATLHRVG